MRQKVSNLTYVLNTKSRDRRQRFIPFFYFYEDEIQK